MLESENLAGWLMLACLSVFIAVTVTMGCVLGVYMAEARHYQKISGEQSTLIDEIWDDFGPRAQLNIRRSFAAIAPSPAQPTPSASELGGPNSGEFSYGSSALAAPSPPEP